MWKVYFILTALWLSPIDTATSLDFVPKSKPAGLRSSAVTGFYLENARFHVLIC
jgi:hypothetical protein